MLSHSVTTVMFLDHICSANGLTKDMSLVYRMEETPAPHSTRQQLLAVCLQLNMFLEPSELAGHYTSVVDSAA